MGLLVEPYNQERIKTGRQQVRLYFIGWEYYQIHNGNPPPVAVKTMPIEMPRLGDHLTLDEVYAKDLIFKTRFKGKPVFVPESEGGKAMAELLLKAVNNGDDLSDLNLERLQVKRKMSVLSDEDLLEELKQRGLSANDADGEVPETPKRVSPPPTKKKESD